MGYKTIQAKRAELKRKIDVYETFLDAVQRINGALSAIEQATQKLKTTREELGKKIGTLNTLGVKEFDDYKKSLHAICCVWGERPLPLKPVEQVVKDAKADLERELDAWIEKQTVAFPSEIKLGMIFRNYKLGRIYEVVGQREISQNINLKGDDAIFYKCEMFEGEKRLGALKLSKTDLSPERGVKFIRT